MKIKQILMIFVLVLCIGCNKQNISKINVLLSNDFPTNNLRILDNQKYIGAVSKNGVLQWVRTPDKMFLEYETNFEKFGDFTIYTQANKLYTISIQSDGHYCEISNIEIKEKGNFIKFSQIEIISAVIVFFLIISIFAIIFMLKKNRANSFYLEGISLYQKRKYDTAIEKLNKACNLDSNNIEYWRMLEKSCIKENRYDLAELCSGNIEHLIKGKKINKKEINLNNISINVDNLLIELKQQGIELDSINIVRKLKNGFSGAVIFLAEIGYKNRTDISFAVLKVEKNNYKNIQDNDLLKEFRGYHKFLINWEMPNLLPENSILLSKKNLVNEVEGISILFSSFADKNNTKDVRTLTESLEQRFDKTLPILNDISNIFLEKSSIIGINIFKNAKEHFDDIVSPFSEKISNIDWKKYGIDRKKQFVNIKGVIYPNISYYITDEKSWNPEKFNLKYLICHGDLNPNNIILTKEGNPIFIDFEKVRETTSYYDFSFISLWLLQEFVLSDNKNHLAEIKLIIEKLKNPNLVLNSNHRFGAFFKILENLYPIKKSISQNDLDGILISFAATSLIRCYYNMRDFKKDDLTKVQFFYALSCQLFGSFLVSSTPKIDKTFDLIK